MGIRQAEVDEITDLLKNPANFPYLVQLAGEEEYRYTISRLVVSGLMDKNTRDNCEELILQLDRAGFGKSTAMYLPSLLCNENVCNLAAKLIKKIGPEKTIDFLLTLFKGQHSGDPVYRKAQERANQIFFDFVTKSGLEETMNPLANALANAELLKPASEVISVLALEFGSEKIADALKKAPANGNPSVKELVEALAPDIMRIRDKGLVIALKKNSFGIQPRNDPPKTTSQNNRLNLR